MSVKKRKLDCATQNKTELSENNDKDEPSTKKRKIIEKEYDFSIIPTYGKDVEKLAAHSKRLRILGKYKNTDLELYENKAFYFLKWNNQAHTLRDYCGQITGSRDIKTETCDITFKEALRCMFGVGAPLRIYHNYNDYNDKIELHKGKYGNYLCYKEKNYSIPKYTSIPESFEDAMEIIENKNKSIIRQFNKEISLRKNDRGNYYIMIKPASKRAKFININKQLLKNFEHGYYKKISLDNIESMNFEFCQQLIAYWNHNYQSKGKWNNRKKWKHLDGPDHFGDRTFSYKYYRCCACNKRTDGECRCGHICSNGCL